MRMPLVHNNQILRERRRELRQRATPMEERLWFQLRGNGLGVKFKRQHSIGGYILDFYCPKKKLIVEVDGKIHNLAEVRKNDAVRNRFFGELGYKILRFSNHEVEKDIKNVLGVISKNLI